MTTQTLDLNNIERKLFWILFGSLSIAIALYLYSAFSLMGSVVARDQISSLSHDASVSSGDLEQEYLVLKNSITHTRAEELGFKEVPVKFTAAPSPHEGELLAKFSSAR